MLTFVPHKIKEDYRKVEFFRVNKELCNNEIYKEYGIGLGTESKCPIYMNDIQVAQIDTEQIIYNDLHNYKIFLFFIQTFE